MKRIIYGAPPSNVPAGGVKVIYRHSEILKSLGLESAVWHPGNNEFKCTWFENSITTVDTVKLSPKLDFLIIPEIWASSYVPMLKGLGFQVAIYVQNCYYTHVNLNSENINAIADAYRDADLIMSISKDTSEYLINIFKVPAWKIVIQRYSIDFNIFHPEKKSKLITYMPRKMEQHSKRVISALKNLLPSEWKIKPLDKMSEREVASNLNESIIFLSFSEFEGLPVPPVEAAISGNYVIGYHGQGGKEYWNAPIFTEIEQGDIQNFINQVLKKIELIEAMKIDIEDINEQIGDLAEYFSAQKEKNFLIEMCNKISSL